ncbi:MAG TPA: B12-binding domain-containing radical SAM protein [Candidatus Wunengus sp. YC60]|uniref:B12-binding domain-containing radical SAM protein n=1 Tax=Candidatus Wunengus sp. YC60 TaxID=3367697 RepID=UPI004026935A
MPLTNNQRSDVILISPENRKNQIYPPFALLFLSSCLEANGISTKIIDIKSEPMSLFQQIRAPNESKEIYFKTIRDTIKSDSPLLVGLTCYTSEYNSVMEVAKIIKETTNTKVVVGGVHATIMPQDFLFKGSPVDFVIIGDGETPLLRLCESIKNKNGSYRQTTGIAYFDNNKIINQGCNVELDLNKFPILDYSKIDMKFYTKPNTGNIRWLLLSAVSIFTGRGCPYNCEFCAVNYLRDLNKDSGKMRYRSIDQVIEELEILKNEYHIDGFYVLDDCFMTSKERVVEFCKKLIKKDLKLIWAAETRVNLIKDESLLELMKKAGLIQLDFGVESGSPNMLIEINKKITVEQIKKAFELCRKHRIRTYANILFNIPNESEEDILLTNKLLNEIKPSVVGCGTTVPLLGSPLYEKFVFPKLTPQEYELYNLDVYERIVDERFRFAKHNLDLNNIVKKLNNKYSEIRTMPFTILYWEKVLKSYHLVNYLNAYLNVLLIKPINRILIYGLKMILNVDNFLFRGNLKNLLKYIIKKRANKNASV